MNLFLSVCLIVKNEEKVLRRCLESIKGIADEIIIADTGSSDKSKDIAREFTNKIYEYKWEDDFSKARNFAASNAAGEWIMVIDADEYVDRESFFSFKSNLKKEPPITNILAVQIVNFLGRNGENTSLNYHERIYKNDGNTYYYRNIHELLKHKHSLEKRGIAQLQLFHSGYMEDVIKGKNKSKRNLTLLKNKKEKDAMDYFFIGNEYSLLKDYEKAITNYKIAYQLKSNINYDWVMKLLVRLVKCLQATERNNEALEIINSGEEIFSYLVDFKFLKGQMYVYEGKEREAIKIFEEILLNKGELKADSSIDYLEYLPHKHLGELYESENQLQLSVQHYSKCLSINDADDYVWVRLISLLANHSSFEELVEFINKNCLSRRTMTPLRLVKILLSVPNLNVKKLTRSYINGSKLSPGEKEALLLKNLLLDGNNAEILKMLNDKNINEIILVLSKRIFNTTDLILLALETKDEKLRNILYDLKFDESIQELLNLLFGKKNKKISTVEEDLFISILKEAHVISMSVLVEYLNKKIEYLGVEGKCRLNKERNIFESIS